MWIQIWVRACVQRSGSFLLNSPTVSDAIAAAGGFRTKPYGPSGIVTIRSRRKSDGLYYRRRQIQIRTVDPSSVYLRHGDNVIVQYDLSRQQVA